MKSNLQIFIDKMNEMSPSIESEIYEICESMTYKESSKFSYSIDTWRAFINHLNEYNEKATR